MTHFKLTIQIYAALPNEDVAVAWTDTLARTASDFLRQHYPASGPTCMGCRVVELSRLEPSVDPHLEGDSRLQDR